MRLHWGQVEKQPWGPYKHNRKEVQVEKLLDTFCVPPKVRRKSVAVIEDLDEMKGRRSKDNRTSSWMITVPTRCRKEQSRQLYKKNEIEQ